MNMGQESEPIEVPVPVCPDQVPVIEPVTARAGPCMSAPDFPMSRLALRAWGSTGP